MADAERVVFTFCSVGKARQTALLAYGGHQVASAGKDLVAVSLMADVPDEFISRRVVGIVNSDGQFDRAQARTQMSTGARNRLHHEISQFTGKSRELVHIESTHV